MNKKERLAGAVLVLTLALGILVDVLDRGNNTPLLAETGPEVRCAVEEGTSGEGPGLAPGPGGREAGSDSSPSEGGSVSGSPRSPDGEYRKIDLNAATLEEIELLPGLGPKKAGAVIAWREEHGRFESVDALLEVKGIGKITLERLAPYVCVGK